MGHCLTPPTGQFVLFLAAHIIEALVKLLSPKWLKGFIDRLPYSIHTFVNKIDLSKCCGNAENLINLFFNFFKCYIKKFQVTLDRKWDIYKCGVKIGQTIAKRKLVTHKKAQNCSTVESKQFVTVLKCLPTTEKVAEPLVIYQAKRVMKAWFPNQNFKKILCLLLHPTLFLSIRLSF